MTLNNKVIFSFLSYQPTFFEEAVKEEHWVEAMNEEIEAIERTRLGILLIFQQTNPT
jgi:hypothetical protein